MDTGAGREKYVAQLDELVARMQGLEHDKQGLQARLDEALKRIASAHEKVFPSPKCEMPQPQG